jgi:hypothetical protein
MPAHFRVSSLIPNGLIVESVIQAAEMLVVTVRAGIQVASMWFTFAARSQLRSAGVGLALLRPERMSSCRDSPILLRTPHCRRRIFAERLDEAVLLVRSRRTWRLDCIVHHLDLALGGRPAASFAERLMLPVSNDAVLRVVRARARPRTEPLNVVGIDDWAFRRSTVMERSSATSNDGAS